ncbi:MAG: ABC transporter ATP-binding protein [Actinomycetaceae bacterium]|nr:ABC transporter ATP-binding protein [Arcanobacterium sp.]MDD7686633.1 ABC transporter ATP-binding protein [Actinomycetaceae bacterium]MDY5273859.1 ABC transporter ATP-binding protein [Arcanobacterium sp.]
MIQPPEDSARAVEVEMHHIDKFYGRMHALIDFDLSINPGEMVVLVGPSGCGKTTALRTLAGLESVTSGRIMIGGHDVTNLPVQKRKLAMVFQAYSLFPHLNALDNVAFGLRTRHVPKNEAEKQAAQALDLVGLSDQYAKFVHQMSGGQQQRVALARALAVRPHVLLLDEPLSALDAKVRVQLRDEIRRIQQEVGMTTLFVTHDQEEALSIADRVGVMHGGRVEQIGSPEDIYNRPETPFVGNFIGVSNKIRAYSDGAQATLYQQRVPLLPGSALGAVEVLIRPEAVQLTPATGRGTHDGATATLVASSFLGALARVTVKTADGTEIVAQLPSTAAAAIPLGQAVAVSFAPIPALAQRIPTQTASAGNS